MEQRINRHHILNDRPTWNARYESKILRQTKSLIPYIDIELHRSLHKELPIVPLLGYHALQRVLYTFEPTCSTTQSIDNLLFSIEEAINHSKTHPIERELGFLTIQAIELEKDYLKGNIN